MIAITRSICERLCLLFIHPPAPWVGSQPCDLLGSCHRAVFAKSAEASHQRDVFEAGNRFRAADASRRPRHVSKPLAMLLSDLGVTKTHSRPHVSNDNPYSRVSSKRSSTVPSSPSGSVRSNTLVTFVEICSAGTTPSTITQASAAYTRVGALRPGGDDRRRSQAGALGLLRSPSGAFCEGNETARNTLSGVDQSTDDENEHQMGAQATSETSDDLQVPLICTIYGDPVVSDSVRLSDPQATEPRGNSGKPGVTVRPPPAAHGAVSRTATHKRLLTKYTPSQNH